MKKIIMIGLIGLFGAVGAQAAVFDSLTSGAWTNTATWAQTNYPGAIVGQSDVAYIYNPLTVTLDAALPETLDALAIWNSAELVLNDGAYLACINPLQLKNDSTMTLNSGSVIDGPSANYLFIGADAVSTGTLNINGGTFNSPNAVFMAYSPATGPIGGSIANLNVTSGSFLCPNWQMIFGGGAGSVVNVNITGGTMEINYLQFFSTTDNGQTETITVDGGDFILSTPNPNGSLPFPGTWAKVFYESGSIIWTGVNTVDQFNSFANVFNGWVDDGNMTSATLPPAELKSRLQFIDGDAVLSMAPLAFPAIPDPVVNLIPNGDFQLSANEDDSANPGANQFNVNGTFGDFASHQQRTADVVDWSPYYADPYGLVPAVGTPHLVDGNGKLDGTFYLDTLIDTNVHHMLLNSSMNYRNGMKQEDILNGVTIDSGKTYTLSVDAVYSDFGSDYSTSPFTVALTDGSGVAVTNPANAIAGSQLTGDLAFWNGVQSTTVSGADLLAAGQVNVIFDLESSFVIPGFPAGSPNPQNLALVSQVQVFEVSLFEPFIQQLGDVNKDGQVTQADVTLANSYLDGSIDGLGDAATRQAELVADGLTGPEALAALNLTSFDIDGNGTFDAADVTALQALVPPLTILTTVLDGSSMTVEVGGLTIGTGYSLMKDTDLVSAPSFDVIADSITAASQTETLTDPNAVEGQAFYKIIEQ